MKKHMEEMTSGIASLGRYGDDRLLHVSQAELDGLASLHPEGELPTNPHTGLPEAFFFLPLLAGLGSLVGGVATGVGTALGTLGAAGAATAAGTAAGTGALAAGTAAAAPAAAGALGATAATAPALGATAAVPAAAGTAATLPALGATAAVPGAAGTAAGTAATTAGLAAPAATAAAPAATGIMGTGLSGSQLLQYGALASMMMPQGGGSDMEEGEDDDKIFGKANYRSGKANFNFKGGNDREHDFFPRSRYYKNGGLVKGYAEGGIASLDTGETPSSDADLVEATRDAILNQSPDADAYIQMFIQTFGKEALKDLIASIEQGAQAMQRGSDGMSDSIPASVDGQGLASLSQGEYVVPADVVSGLGNGDTQAGAKQLKGMVDRTRQMRNGGTVQPPPINPSQVMPG